MWAEPPSPLEGSAVNIFHRRAFKFAPEAASRCQTKCHLKKSICLVRLLTCKFAASSAVEVCAPETLSPRKHQPLPSNTALPLDTNCAAGHKATRPRHGHNAATTWPRHVHDMATTWPRHGHDMATTWPRHGHDMATTWPRHGHDMATTRPQRGHDAPATCRQHVHDAPDMPVTCPGPPRPRPTAKCPRRAQFNALTTRQQPFIKRARATR